MPPPRLLFVCAEAYPLAKTGGLADVCAALPAALARAGVDVRLILPGYRSALDGAVAKRDLLALPDGARLVLGRMPDTGLPVYLYDRAELFRRDGGLYQDADRRDWPDNHVRYGAFCQAAAELAMYGDGAGWRPQLVHAHDWHTALVPALLAQASPRLPCVLTIHNLVFQGNFPLHAAAAIELPPALRNSNAGEFYGQFSFLKLGISYADRLTTVSPTYARDILTPEHGAGMDGLLRSRAERLVGILNGVDGEIWNPATDAHLPNRYSHDDMSGKLACKAAVQQELGFEPSEERPLICFLNRLTHQKMADVGVVGDAGVRARRFPVRSARQRRPRPRGSIRRGSQGDTGSGGADRLPRGAGAPAERRRRHLADAVSLRTMRAHHYVRHALRDAAVDASRRRPCRHRRGRIRHDRR
jgi:starch synthase